MPIEDVFSISGRGTVVTGRIERGIVKVGDEVEVVALRPTLKTPATGAEGLPRQAAWIRARRGIPPGYKAGGTKREEVERGQVPLAPFTITPHTNFQAERPQHPHQGGGRHKYGCSSPTTGRNSISAPPT